MHRLRVRVDLGAMAMKGYSTILKPPALLKPHYQIVSCHIQDPRLRFLFLYRDVVGVSCCSSWLGHISSIKKDTSIIFFCSFSDQLMRTRLILHSSQAFKKIALYHLKTVVEVEFDFQEQVLTYKIFLSSKSLAQYFLLLTSLKLSRTLLRHWLLNHWHGS